MASSLEITEEIQKLFIKENSPTCSYCLNQEPKSLMKCLGCERWFCNTKETEGPSHIIHHLVRAQHNEVMLHNQNDLGENALECYGCGGRNIFLLGFLLAKENTVVILLCRQPCLMTSLKKETEWNTSNWSPLIQEGSIVSWLVKHSNNLPKKKITTKEMLELEKQWKEKRVNDYLNIKGKKTMLRYNSVEHYFDTFLPLLIIEDDYERCLKESQKQANTSIKWEIKEGEIHATFVITTQSANVRMTIGDEIIIKGENEFFKGYIFKTPSFLNDKTVVKFEKDTVFPKKENVLFSIEFVYKPTSFERMKKALVEIKINKKLKENKNIGIILGEKKKPKEKQKKKEKLLNTPGTPPLNQFQLKAVLEAVGKNFTIIQGPPGTGKTVVLASIAYNIFKKTNKKILVCAPSNIAVDNLAEKIDKTGLNVIRFSSKNKKLLNDSILHLYFDQKVKSNEKLLNFLKEKNYSKKKYLKLKKKIEHQIIEKANVICCTCIGAGANILSFIKFGSVLIDEAAQATEPESLVPIIKGIEKVVLVGDHKQLGPVVLDKKAHSLGYGRSLFERLVLIGYKPSLLQKQYRMHPCLSSFSSELFYEGAIIDGVTSLEKTKNNFFLWPSPGNPILFYHSNGLEEVSFIGTSYLNQTEVRNCEKIISFLLKNGVNTSEIGVVTPYEGQRAFLFQYLKEIGTLKENVYDEIEIENIDSFQGREKDYIILSCVRSNDSSGIGFLGDQRRLNVAITRARLGLFVLGNGFTLIKNKLWSKLMTLFQKKECFVEGDLDSLRKCDFFIKENLKKDVISETKLMKDLFDK